MKKQQGMSIVVLFFVLILVVGVVTLGFKLVPVYTEYFSARSDLKKVVVDVPITSPDASFRASFEKYREIDEIDSIEPNDLVISRANGSVQLSADYLREVSLFGNASLLFRFHISSSE